jgi:predicted dienelactone hydrolase
LKLFLKILGLVGLLLLALALFLTFSHQPEDFPAGSESAARLQSGPWTVATLKEEFVDTGRPTQANADFTGADSRTLPGTVWYPQEAEAGAVPLLVYSHGFTSLRSNGAYLGEHLASHGFVVVAVDYPLTSMGAPGGPMVSDVANQPADVSFLLDTLLGYSAVAGHALSGRIDAQRIGALGVSLGGLTSTLVGFHPQWSDSRIRAVLSIAGPTNFFLPEFFRHADPAFMMLAGDLDVLVPYASNAATVPEKVPGAALVTIHGGSHTGFSGGTAMLRAMKNTDALGCFAVQRNIAPDELDKSAGLLGAPGQGIDYSVANELCTVDPLPKTLNVLRQQMIARVVVRAFFDKTLAADPARRAAAALFLETQLDAELADVSYERREAD